MKTLERIKKRTRFTATDPNTDEKQTWAFFKDGAWWVLRDASGYERTLEKTWRDSVPRILLILDNHGFTANIS